MSTAAAAAARRMTWRARLCDTLRERDRRAGKHDRTRRLRDVIGEHKPWWDWGHQLMALTGRDDCGNWGPPRARDLYMRHGWERGADRVALLGSDLQRVTTTDAMTAWDGVRRGEEWRTFDWQDDGSTLRVGWLGDDGRLHDSGITGSEELRLFRRWFIWDSWIKTEWFGLRRWLYYRGLHHAVDHRIPFTCGLTPPRGSGGYSHWHCQVRRPLLAILAGRRQQHDGPHRFVNYRWDDAGHRVDYDPQPVAR